MNRHAALVKCRHLLGKLEPHGIRASRVTAGVAASEGAPEAVLTDEKKGRLWLVGLWAGRSWQVELDLDDRSDGSEPLSECARRLVAWRAAHRPPEESGDPALLILAPALGEDEGTPPADWWPGGGAVTILGSAACRRAEALAGAVDSVATAVLSAEERIHWRSEVVPEVRIEPLRPRRARVREEEPPVAPLLLDYPQERCARLDLELLQENDSLVGDFKVRLVGGVAGCGKTLVLLHRAALLAKHFSHARVLVVTHNRPLAFDLRRRLAAMGAGERVECLTFNQWLWKTAPPRGKLMQSYEVRDWIERARGLRPLTRLRGFSARWLAEEMAWMCDHGHADESYCEAERAGRRIPLSRNQRHDMLELLRAYRAHLAAAGRDDWSAWPLSVVESHFAGRAGEQFDHVLVDEAQFFSPVGIELLRRAAGPGAHFFFCADPTQGFLRRRVSWNRLGFEMRNRSVRLERPYRSTRAIIEFAAAFYRRRLGEEEEPVHFPDPEWLATREAGAPPLVRQAGAKQDRLRRLAEEIDCLSRAGVPAADVLVLVAGRELSERTVVEALEASLGAGSADMAKAGGDGGGVRVAHLMAATGLERPIVFLLGLDDLAAAESDPTLNAEERSEMIRDHTRQIYVGLTRAMERLVVFVDDERMRAALGEKESGAVEEAGPKFAPISVTTAPAGASPSRKD